MRRLLIFIRNLIVGLFITYIGLIIGGFLLGWSASYTAIIIAKATLFVVVITVIGAFKKKKVKSEEVKE